MAQNTDEMPLSERMEMMRHEREETTCLVKVVDAMWRYDVSSSTMSDRDRLAWIVAAFLRRPLTLTLTDDAHDGKGGQATKDVFTLDFHTSLNRTATTTNTIKRQRQQQQRRDPTEMSRAFVRYLHTVDDDEGETVKDVIRGVQEFVLGQTMVTKYANLAPWNKAVRRNGIWSLTEAVQISTDTSPGSYEKILEIARSSRSSSGYRPNTTEAAWRWPCGDDDEGGVGFERTVGLGRIVTTWDDLNGGLLARRREQVRREIEHIDSLPAMESMLKPYPTVDPKTFTGFNLVVPFACTIDLPDGSTLRLPPMDISSTGGKTEDPKDAPPQVVVMSSLFIPSVHSSRNDVQVDATFPLVRISSHGLVKSLPRSEAAAAALRFLELLADERTKDVVIEKIGHLVGKCLCCGRKLKANASVDRAMGPVCYGRASVFSKRPSSAENDAHDEIVRQRITSMRERVVRATNVLPDDDGEASASRSQTQKKVDDITEQLKRLRPMSTVVEVLDELLEGVENSAEEAVRLIADSCRKTGVLESESPDGDVAQDERALQIIQVACRDMALFYMTRGDSPLFVLPDGDGILPEENMRLYRACLVGRYLGLTEFVKRASFVATNALALRFIQPGEK